jgi:hypothetical protein
MNDQEFSQKNAERVALKLSNWCKSIVWAIEPCAYKGQSCRAVQGHMEDGRRTGKVVVMGSCLSVQMAHDAYMVVELLAPEFEIVEAFSCGERFK